MKITNRRSVGFLPTVVANLIPLTGVSFFGWDPGTLAFVYAVELLVAVLAAGIKGLFAQQPPDYDQLGQSHGGGRLYESDGTVETTPSDLERRLGRVTLVDALPPVYPRNVSSLSSSVEISLFFAIVLFGFLAAVVDPLAAVTEPAVVVSVVSLLVSHVAVIDRQYLRQRRYKTASPRSVFAVPTQEAGVVAGVLVLGATGLDTTAFLLVAVVVKTLVDWGSYRENGLFGWFTHPKIDRTVREVDPPEERVTASVRTDRRAVLFAGMVRALTNTLPIVPVLFFVWLALGLLVRGADVNWFAITVGVFGLVPLSFVVLETFEYVLTHRWMSYQRRGETLVAHDELTDTPQWTAEIGGFRAAELCHEQLADRVFDSRTLAVTPTGADGDRTLAHLRSAVQAIEAFEFPLGSTNYGSLDLRIAGCVLVMTAVIVVAEISLVVTPFGPKDIWILLPFSVPFTIIIGIKTWTTAYRS